MVGVTIRGAPEISRKLRRVDAALGKRIVRKAFRQALKPLKSRVQELAPVKTGQTRKAVKVLSGRGRKGRIVMRLVIGKKNYVGDQYYGAFQEFGWRKGSRKLGKSREQVPGKHFMKQAYDEKAEQTKADAERLILDGIMSEVKG